MLYLNPNRVNIIRTTCHSIHLNIAFEQYLFKKLNVVAPLLFLWSNDRNVVIGKHQNPWKECNIQKMQLDGVQLCRRNSGGGAVYQDLGNHCFTFLNQVTANHDIKAQNNDIILQALKNLGITGEASGRNDLLVNGRKISGSAYQLSLGSKANPNRIALHHGTMLVSCNFTDVTKYLSPNKKKLQSKGVDSVAQRVINLNEIIPTLTPQIWEDELAKEFKRRNNDYNEINITEEEMLAEKSIKDHYEQLTSHEWLYIDIPEFSNNMEEKFSWGLVDIYVNVKKGYIVDGQVFSDCLVPEFITKMNEEIKSGKYEYTFPGIRALTDQLVPINEQYAKEIQEWLLKVM